MKLHPPKRTMAVLYRHDYAVIGPGSAMQVIRQVSTGQGVIANNLELLRQIAEQSFPGMGNTAAVAMYRAGCMGDRPPQKLCDTLMTQADAEQGHRRLHNHLCTHPKVFA
ncbi:hypothetical protein D3C77_560910 [compost metagenome]